MILHIHHAGEGLALRVNSATQSAVGLPVRIDASLPESLEAQRWLWSLVGVAQVGFELDHGNLWTHEWFHGRLLSVLPGTSDSGPFVILDIELTHGKEADQ